GLLRIQRDAITRVVEYACKRGTTHANVSSGSPMFAPKAMYASRLFSSARAISFLLAEVSLFHLHSATMIKVLLIGDYSDSIIAHGAIPKALALSAQKLSVEVAHEWLATDQITSPNSIATK